MTSITPPAGFRKGVAVMLAALTMFAGLAAPAAHAADSNLPVHDLIKETSVPPQYGAFVFDSFDIDPESIVDVTGMTATTNTTNQADDPYSDSANKPGTKKIWVPAGSGEHAVTIRHAGDWTDAGLVRHAVDARIGLKDTSHGYLYWRPDTRSVGVGIDNIASDKPRESVTVTVTFTAEDGTPLTGFKGVTGFTDLDGAWWDASLPNEGWELLDGFDAVYKRSDAHLQAFGTNGWRGIQDEDNGPAGSEHDMQHYIAVTFSQPTLTLRYSTVAKSGLNSGFQPIPATAAYPLLYDANGGSGTLPKQDN